MFLNIINSCSRRTSTLKAAVGATCRYSTDQAVETIKEESETTAPNVTNNQLIRLEEKPPNLTFAQMFRRSKFVSLGDLRNKYLIGRIVEVVGNDLYIDYGGKFNAVCKMPEKNAKYAQMT